MNLRLPRASLDDVLLVIGPSVITCGLWIVAPAAGLVFGGLVLTIYGYAIARTGKVA